MSKRLLRPGQVANFRNSNVNRTVDQGVHTHVPTQKQKMMNFSLLEKSNLVNKTGAEGIKNLRAKREEVRDQVRLVNRDTSDDNPLQRVSRRKKGMLRNFTHSAVK